MSGRRSFARLTVGVCARYGARRYPQYGSQVRRSLVTTNISQAENTPYKGLKKSNAADVTRAKGVSDMFIPHDKPSRLAVKLFLEASQFDGGVEAITADFKALSNLISKDADWNIILNDPVTPNGIRREGIDLYMNENPNLHQITKRSLDMLKDTRSLTLLLPLYNTLESLSDVFFQRVPISVIFAKQVPKGTALRLIETVKKNIPSDSRPEFIVKVDPSLLKGFKILVGTQVYVDASGLGRLDEAGEQYLSALEKVNSFLKNYIAERKTWDLDRSSVDKNSLEWFARAQSLLVQEIAVSSDKSKPTEAVDMGSAVDSEIDFESTPELRNLNSLYSYALEK